MRFLALATSDDAWFDALAPDEVARLSAAEARRAWELRAAGVIREMSWRTDRHDVVIELEAVDEAAAIDALGTLPLVAAGAITFELVGLRPYDGWARLFEPTQALTVERAIAWALERVGATTYALRCLAFVEDAYERPNAIEVFGGDCARESAERYGAGGDAVDAPRGALVFFDTAGDVAGERRDWGHAGLALGDGRIVHAWPEVRIDRIADVPSLPSGGWSTPRYRGWTPPARVLEGSRPVRP